MSLHSLYIVPLTQNSGSVSISLGLIEYLKLHFHNISFYKPIVKDKNDEDILLIKEHFHINTHSSFSYEEIETLLSENKIDTIYENIISKYEQIKKSNDFIIIQGNYDITLQQILLQNIHLSLAKNISVPVITTINAKNKSTRILHEFINISQASVKNLNLEYFGTVLNKIDPNNYDLINDFLSKENMQDIFTLPYIEKVQKLTLQDLLDCLSISQIDIKKDIFIRLLMIFKLFVMKNLFA